MAATVTKKNWETDHFYATRLSKYMLQQFGRKLEKGSKRYYCYLRRQMKVIRVPALPLVILVQFPLPVVHVPTNR